MDALRMIRRPLAASRAARFVALAAVALVGAVPAWRFLGQATDDIFITYRYADNLARGAGLVFNPGERVFGVSDPGVALVLGVASVVSRSPPHLLGTWLTYACLLAIAAALLRAGAAAGRLPEAALGCLLLAGNRTFWVCQGSGPVVALAALLWSAIWIERRPVLAGLLAGFAVWSRPDALLAVLILALLDLWSRRNRRGTLAFALALAAMGVVGALGAAFAFGTLLPGTLAAKRHFAALAPAFFTPAEFWRRAHDALSWSTGGSTWATIGPGLVGLGVLARRPEPPWRLLAFYGVASAALYTALAVPFFLWYTLPAFIALLFGWCFALGAALRFLGRGDRSARAARLAAAGAAALVVLFAAWCLFRAAGAGRDWLRRDDAGDWRAWGYRAAGEWIRGHSAPGDEIAFHEVGIVAYFSQRPVRDLVGLVSAEVRPYAAVGDSLGAFLLRPTEFVLFHTFGLRGGTRGIVERPWFAGAYSEAASFEHPAGAGRVVVFRRRSAASLPPPRPPRRRPGAPLSPGADPAGDRAAPP